ncbi:MAG TPA: class I SAM-dependent methyltransferase [Streptosporangiaceae bacterium]|nr:class I SAM-dependent methyltransferase [Streptosporangiaceae bacterium]
MSEVTPGTNAAQAQRWNGESGHYWITHRERHLAGHRNLTPRMFAAAAIAAGERVLDVGCGCGATTITAARSVGRAGGAGPVAWLAGHDDPGGAVGLDLSAPMLGVARRLAAEAGVSNIGFVQGDAQVCPLRRGSFDVVISSFGVMFFGDPVVAFANIGSSLRPGGRLAFLCWQHDTHNELFAIPLHAFAAHMGPPGPAAGDLFMDPRQVKALLSGTGWVGVDVEPVSEPAWMGRDVADVMDYVRGMPMIRALVASLGDEVIAEAAFARVADEYAARQQPDGVWVRAAAWLVTASRRRLVR